MTPEGLLSYQRALGMTDRQFADFVCAGERNVRRWKRGTQDIPAWMQRFLPAIVLFETDDNVSPFHLRQIVRSL